MKIQYPFIQDEILYSKVLADVYNSLNSNTKNFQTPYYYELSQRLTLESISIYNINILTYPKIKKIDTHNILTNPVDGFFKNDIKFRESIPLNKLIHSVVLSDVVRYHMFSSSFITMYSLFENYVTSVFLHALNSSDLSSRKKLSKVVKYKGINGVFQIFEENFSLSKDAIFGKKLSNFEEFRNKRNCIVHHSGVISYKNYEKMGYDSSSIGGKVIINDVVHGQTNVLIIILARLIEFKIFDIFGTDIWGN